MHTASFIGIGIDTARYGHHVSFLDQEKRTATKPFHFRENAEGYRRFDMTLRRLCEKHPGVQLHVRIDAAGQYAENLITWLHRLDLPLEISVGQPARNKAYRKAHFDKRKADPVESLACARFAVVERPETTPLTPSEFSQLRDVIALLEASAKHRTRLINQLHGLLARSLRAKNTTWRWDTGWQSCFAKCMVSGRATEISIRPLRVTECFNTIGVP